MRERFADSLRHARRATDAAVSSGQGRAGTRSKAGTAEHELVPEERGTRCEEERASSAGAPPPVGCPSEAASTAELRAAVHALPVAIEAARLREGEPLALSFGRSLDVEIRAGPGGVELTLRPEARLARAAEAELPALVAALRRRGIAVTRAEVRARGGAQGHQRLR